MTQQTPPYYIETTTQRLARLGVELAQLRRQEHNSPMTLEHINRMTDRMEAITNEILTISENWTPSNE